MSSATVKQWFSSRYFFVPMVAIRAIPKFLKTCFVWPVLTVLLFLAPRCNAYSVLTHEALVDLAWNESIRPFLLSRFPQATEAQLLEAHAYAYGGSAIQDMGYYPFGHQFFSDLTHYVRTGDFVNTLFRDARTMNECAFAAGALAHYLGDAIGHSEAINPATGVEFPKLQKEFGPSVTYDQSPHAHIRTEFAFDVEALAIRAYAPSAYLRYIGLRVPHKFLERVFLETYGFNLRELLGRAHPAVKSYRSAVRSFIPIFAQAELVLHRHQFVPYASDRTLRIFTARTARSNYRQWWNTTYKGPGLGAHLLAALVYVVPKIGAAEDLAIKIPTPQTHEWYLQSVNHTVDEYQADLSHVKTAQELLLDNLNLDTGKTVKLGAYPRIDQTYSKLLERLTSNPDNVLPTGLKRDILDFYGAYNPSSPTEGNKNKDLFRRLMVLRQMRTSEHGCPTKNPIIIGAETQVR